MRRSLIVATFPFVLALSACDTPIRTESEVESAASSMSSAVSTPLLQIPDPMTIEAFGKMRLEGTDLILEGIETENDAYTRHAISYRSNGLKITGVLLIPKGEGPFPLLILNHGYIDPFIYTRGRGLKREQDYLARQGFAVLHTDYRGHAGGDKSPMDEETKIYDGNLEYAMDSANAIYAIRNAKLPTIDASRIGMMGHSMGGGVTLAILTALPDLVNAAVLYAPVHADVYENFTRWRRERPEGDRTLTVMKTREEDPTAWDALSPATYINEIEAPILLCQGNRDNDVPKEWSDDLAKLLTEHEKQFEYVEYENEGHEFGPMWSDFMRRTATFFNQALQVTH